MEDENQVANHSDTVETSYEATETTADTSYEQAETSDPVTTQEAPTEPPKGFTVKYNKEERFVSEDEAPTWIQKGLNYDKVAERAALAEQYQQHLERTAKYHGFESVDEYVSELSRVEQERIIAEEAKKYGVPEDFIRQELAPLKGELETLRQERTKLEQERNAVRVRDEVTQLKAKYPDFEQREQEVFQFALENGYKLEDAYRLVTYEDRIKQAQQETIAKVTGRDQKQILPSNDQPNNIQYDPNNMSTDEILKLSERVQRGERITL
jgi:hypothetical protein